MTQVRWIVTQRDGLSPQRPSHPTYNAAETKWKSAERYANIACWLQQGGSKTFRPAADPFPGMQDRQNLISWRWSLPLPTNPVWWGSMHAISSYRGNRPTHTQTHTHRQDRLQYIVPLSLARCVINFYFTLLHYYPRSMQSNPVAEDWRVTTKQTGELLTVMSTSPKHLFNTAQLACYCTTTHTDCHPAEWWSTEQHMPKSQLLDPLNGSLWCSQ